MNYEKLIRQAVKKRELTNLIKEQGRERELKQYVKQIKLLAPKIKVLLNIGRMLHENKFDYKALCTDSWAHRVGFVYNVTQNYIGIFAGGACGEFDLIVNERGVPFMLGRKGKVEPRYEHLLFLKRFVNEFAEFEFRVKQFVKSL